MSSITPRFKVAGNKDGAGGWVRLDPEGRGLTKVSGGDPSPPPHGAEVQKNTGSNGFAALTVASHTAKGSSRVQLPG